MNENKGMTLDEMVGKSFIYSNPENKIYFENNRGIVQRSFFNDPWGWVLDWQKEFGGYLIQVVFPLLLNDSNNHYFIFVYKFDTKELIVTALRSKTIFPPVWNRHFSIEPDYLDYIEIQEFLCNRLLPQNDLPAFEIDREYGDKVVHLVTQSLKEIEELISRGESYRILSMKASKFFNETKPVAKWEKAL